MALVIPPFVAYQAPLYPVASNWQSAPAEGPRFIAAEIDWGVTVAQGLAVQFALSSGPVEFSQICAFSVDNGRNGSDVDFIFPDTGKQLTVPAYAQGVYPVFTNAMTFYVVSSGAVASDVTVFEILNVYPYPVSVLPSTQQATAAVTSVPISANGATVIVPAGVSGTVTGWTITMSLYDTGASSEGFNYSLVDGVGNPIVLGNAAVAASSTQTVTNAQSGTRIRFRNGLNFNVGSTTVGTGFAAVNVYYSVP